MSLVEQETKKTISESGNGDPSPIRDELEFYFSYLESTRLSGSQKNPFLFWDSNKKRLPLLYHVAISFLSMPASTASVERLFSMCGLSAIRRRNRIGASLLEHEALLSYNSY